jgi:sugar phosphate isomerase/epimerase
VELRHVRGINVLDFDKPLRAELKGKLRDAGMGVICIGSPIGKVKITDPWEPHFERFKTAVALAEEFGAPYVRIFSYYPPQEGGDMQAHREEVLRRMEEKVRYVKGREVTILHENEKGIFGDRGGSCFDLVVSVNSPKFQCAFDFANYIQVGESPLSNWRRLKPYVAHIHIKDAKFKTGTIVPAGQGDGDVGRILADAYQGGYRGFLALEPHLAKDMQFSGFSGPELFKTAVDALKALCRKNKVPIAGEPPIEPEPVAAPVAKPSAAPSVTPATPAKPL